MQSDTGKTSKYIKTGRENKAFKAVSVIFVFCLYVMPQYFGLNLPGFDLTTLRLMLIVLLVLIFDNESRKNKFLGCIGKKYSVVLFIYLFVCFYTMIFRADIKALLNPFLELVAFFLTVYVFKYELGAEKSYKLIVGFVYLMTILGIVEYFMGHTPFEFMVTLDGIYTGRFVRSGNYRIMSSFGHSLGYGLMLVTVAPFGCLDEKKNEINFLAHLPLLFLIVINVVLTGSRSTLAVLLLELGVLFFFSKKQNAKKTLFIGSMILVAFVVLLFALQSTPIGRYFLLQITSIIDQLFGTTYSEKYGANLAALSQSSHYRDLLLSIFKLSWLNPILGIGRKRSFSGVVDGFVVHSIDNHYVAEYIRYAYPGLLAKVLLFAYFILNMIKSSFAERNGIVQVLMIGTAAYMLNLWWVDDLGTLKYLYVIFALFIVFTEEKDEKAFAFSKEKVVSELNASRYLRY